MNVRHLLVTNDFPPKVGGIQSYLWELWRRLPAESFAVLTTPYPGASEFDAQQPFRVVRARERFLAPTPWLARRVDALANEIGADLVVLDPALPLGRIGPTLGHPYAVVVHGAEVTVPGRLPGPRHLLGSVLRGARLVVAAGEYSAAEAERAARRPLPTVTVPPGVDTDRFTPLDRTQRRVARVRHGLDPEAPVVVTVSRLVPRKGMDTLVRAAARLRHEFPDLVVAIAGDGRDRRRLERLARQCGAPVRFLGRVPDRELAALYGCADVFAMLCRTRWAGLEQEGFGIVFVEAAAAGVPQIAGSSGGAADAVHHGVTGWVVEPPEDPAAVVDALRKVLGDDAARAAMGRAARARAEAEFSYQVLVDRLARSLESAVEAPV